MKTKPFPAVAVSSVAAALLCGLAPCVRALVNPSLQPMHLAERYRSVLVLETTVADMEAHLVRRKVLRVVLGEFAPTEIAIAVDPEAAEGGGDAETVAAEGDENTRRWTKRSTRAARWSPLNGDGRLDVLACARGALLVQGADGRFAAVAGLRGLDLRAGSKFETGLTGAGCMAPVWRSDRMDLVLPMDSGMALLTNEGGEPRSVAGYVDGDGANDLLLGGLDGRLVLALSDCLALREPGPYKLEVRYADGHTVYRTIETTPGGRQTVEIVR